MGFQRSYLRLRARFGGRADAAMRSRDSFVLTRIIGNDLPPRHEDGRSLANLRFILEHEPALADCEKRWIVNRVVDPDRRAAIEDLLTRHGQSFLTIPFDLAEYAAVEWDLEGLPRSAQFHRAHFHRHPEAVRERVLVRLYRAKNNYVMNNNGARNRALADGRGRAKWILPWDGNCFLTEAAWHAFRRALARAPRAKFAIVPMARVVDNSELLDPGFVPRAEDEPQIAFRADAEASFDEEVPYGRRPKVELLLRLGVPGPWDRWKVDPWDKPFGRLSPEAFRTVTAGWVARLGSGVVDGRDGSRTTIQERGVARNEGIVRLIDGLDERLMRREYDPARPLTVDLAALAAQTGPEWSGLREALSASATEARERGPFSVLQKEGCAPSGDKQDYFSVAPYYWPNPKTKDGLPYVRRDGQRVPGTALHEPGSERYDRSRLQRVFDDTLVLALDWAVTGSAVSAEHAALLVRTWFVDPATRMNPNLAFTQIRPGFAEDLKFGNGTGIIEAKDIFYLLDAVRLLEAAGALDAADQAGLRSWLRDYLGWLTTAHPAIVECGTANNHGTAFDIHQGAVAAYLGDVAALRDVFRRSKLRIAEQFTADGRQPREMARTLTQHYCCFNLQLWVILAQMAERCGIDLAQYRSRAGLSLRPAFDRFFGAVREGWEGKQIEPFETERVWPLHYAYARWYGAPKVPAAAVVPAVTEVPPVFLQTAAVRPFWQLGWRYG